MHTCAQFPVRSYSRVDGEVWQRPEIRRWFDAFSTPMATEAFDPSVSGYTVTADFKVLTGTNSCVFRTVLILLLIVTLFSRLWYKKCFQYSCVLALLIEYSSPDI